MGSELSLSPESRNDIEFQETAEEVAAPVDPVRGRIDPTIIENVSRFKALNLYDVKSVSQF